MAEKAGYYRTRRVLGIKRSRSLVDAVGSRRRVEALCRLGYSIREQARRCDRDIYAFRGLLKKRYLFAETRDRVARMYSELWDQPLPHGSAANRVRAMAAKRGYHPPMAWDDDTIDDPDALPADQLEDTGDFDEIAVSLVVDERVPMNLARVDRIEARRRLYAAGLSESAIWNLTHGIRPREETTRGRSVL